MRHGLTHTKEYKRYRSIVARCYVETSRGYRYYGGRGITFYWLNDPVGFSDYLRKLPGYEQNLTLDRIDNNKNYEPGNLQWTTSICILFVIRKPKTNTSGFVGVRNVINGNKSVWKATLVRDKKVIFIGYFDTIEEAYNKRCDYIKLNNLNEYKN